MLADKIVDFGYRWAVVRGDKRKGMMLVRTFQDMPFAMKKRKPFNLVGQRTFSDYLKALIHKRKRIAVGYETRLTVPTYGVYLVQWGTR